MKTGKMRLITIMRVLTKLHILANQGKSTPHFFIFIFLSFYLFFFFFFFPAKPSSLFSKVVQIRQSVQDDNNDDKNNKSNESNESNNNKEQEEDKEDEEEDDKEDEPTASMNACMNAGNQKATTTSSASPHASPLISNASSYIDIEANTGNEMALDAPGSVKGFFSLFSMFIYSYSYFSATVNTSFTNLNAGKYFFLSFIL